MSATALAASAGLRAAVLGANDGIVSTASLVLGVAAAHATHGNVMIAGIAGLVAGAMSMAAGEYVSVRSQADSEQAALDLERSELAGDDQGEHRELTAIYGSAASIPSLAKQVAEQLMAHDALGAHARDELGISEVFSARPDSGGAHVGGQFCGWRLNAVVGGAIFPDSAADQQWCRATSLLFLADPGWACSTCRRRARHRWAPPA